MEVNGSGSVNNATLSIRGNNVSLAVTYLIISVLILVCNSVVMIVIVKSRELHIPTLWHLSFMALCDFSYGLYYLILVVPSAFLNRFAYPDWLIGFASGLLTLLFGQNILNVVIATVDRFISVCWPLRYSQLITPKRFSRAIFVTALINVTRLCVIIFPDSDYYYHPVISVCVANFNTAVKTTGSVGLPVISFLIIVTCLIKIYLELYCLRRRNRMTRGSVENLTFSFTIAVAACVFCVSFVPVTFIIVLNFILGKGKVSMITARAALVCLVSNSVWNVVIYSTTYRPFKNAFLRLFCKSYHRRQRRIEVAAITREYMSAK